MDPTALAAAVTALLAPYIAKAGEKLAERVGESLPEQMGKLWSAVAAKFKGRPAAAEAAKDLAAAPQDEDNQAAFRKELKKLLSEDADFITQLLPVFQAAQLVHDQVGDIFMADNAFKVGTNYGQVIQTTGEVEVNAGDVLVGGVKQEIGVQVTNSTIGGDVTGRDKK